MFPIPAAWSYEDIEANAAYKSPTSPVSARIRFYGGNSPSLFNLLVSSSQNKEAIRNERLWPFLPL